jgi:outer membrane protein TolC
VQLNVRRAQEALGVALGSNLPVDASSEPAFEIPAETPEATWMSNRPDVQLFTAEARAAERVVKDSSKDWWPSGGVSFDPQLLSPSGIFQPSRTWRLTFALSQPIYTGGEQAAQKHEREALLRESTLSLERLQIQARSEERLARATVQSGERALASARRAADQANEVLKITITAFDAGASTNIEVIDAQRSARDLEAAVVVIEDAVRQARLDLLVALGRFPR